MQCLREKDSPAWNYTEDQVRSQEAIVGVMTRCRLRWYVGGGGDSYCRRAEMAWQNTVSADMCLLGVNHRTIRTT